MDSKILVFLLKGGHINMSDRIEKGVWPHPPLLLSELVRVIGDYLKLNKWFPHEWRDIKDGSLVDDVSAIEKINENLFIYRSRKANPSNLSVIDRIVEKEFNNAEKVAIYYLRRDLMLPGDLDGWRVIDDLEDKTDY